MLLESNQGMLVQERRWSLGNDKVGCSMRRVLVDGGRHDTGCDFHGRTTDTVAKGVMRNDIHKQQKLPPKVTLLLRSFRCI